MIGSDGLIALASDHAVAAYDGQQLLWRTELQEKVGEIRIIGKQVVVSHGGRVDFWRNGIAVAVPDIQRVRQHDGERERFDVQCEEHHGED